MMSYQALLPELAMIVFLGVLAVRMLFEKRAHHPETSLAALAASSLPVFGSLLALRYTSGIFIQNSVAVDSLSQHLKFLVAIILFVLVLLSRKSIGIPFAWRTEALFFMASSAFGIMILVGANDLLTFYIALELSAYSLYVLVPMRKDVRSAEAGFKYLIFGAVMSAVTIYGISLVVGLCGSTSFAAISAYAQEAHNPVFVFGLICIIASLLFKLASVPFHFWAPDAYEVAPTSVTAFLATASKAAGVAGLLRLLSVIGPIHSVSVLLAVIACISMTYGNLVALHQKDLKRLMAYSGIAQSGYILMGLLGQTTAAYRSVLFYLFVYALTNLSVFVVIILVGRQYGNNNPSTDHLKGLSRHNPVLALLLMAGVLSLAGIPPLAGFCGKWFLFTEAMQSPFGWLVPVAAVNTVVSLYYYLMLVKHAFVDEASSMQKKPFEIRYHIACLLLLVSLILLGLFPSPFFNRLFI